MNYMEFKKSINSQSLNVTWFFHEGGENHYIAKTVIAHIKVRISIPKMYDDREISVNNPLYLVEFGEDGDDSATYKDADSCSRFIRSRTADLISSLAQSMYP